MKKLLLAFFALSLSWLSSEAYTARELATANTSVMKYTLNDNILPAADAIEFRYGNYVQRQQVDGSTGSLAVVLIDENTIQVMGMINGNAWAQFRISGTTATLLQSSADMWKGKMAFSKKPVSGDPIDSYFSSTDFFSMERVYCDAFGYYHDYDKKWTGTIESSDKGYQISFNSPLCFNIYDSDGRHYKTDNVFYNMYALFIPKFNAKATDTYQSDKGDFVNADRNYQAYISIQNDGSNFNLLNLGCRGFAVKNTTLNYAPYIGSVVDNFQGHFDWANKKVYINNQQGASDITELVKYYNGQLTAGSYIYQYWVCPVSSYTTNSDGTINVSRVNSTADVPGDIYVNDVHHDAACKNYWHKNCGGDLKTTEEFEFTLEPYVLYNRTRGDYYGPYLNSKYELERELTHDVELTIDQWGCDATNGIYFEASIPGNVNPDYLEDYDIYLVSNKYTSINNSGFQTDMTHGHKKGILVDDQYDFKMAPKANMSKVAGVGKTFSKLVPASVIKAADPNANLTLNSTDFTLYLRTRYNHDNLQQPSFHALTSPTRATTGVNDLQIGDELANIKVVDGGIAISGSNGTAMVSTLSGVVVYQGGDNTVSVAPGMYIVRAAGAVKKVLVK